MLVFEVVPGLEPVLLVEAVLGIEALFGQTVAPCLTVVLGFEVASGLQVVLGAEVAPGQKIVPEAVLGMEAVLAADVAPGPKSALAVGAVLAVEGDLSAEAALAGQARRWQKDSRDDGRFGEGGSHEGDSHEGDSLEAGSLGAGSLEVEDSRVEGSLVGCICEAKDSLQGEGLHTLPSCRLGQEPPEAHRWAGNFQEYAHADRGSTQAVGGICSDRTAAASSFSRQERVGLRHWHRDSAFPVRSRVARRLYFGDRFPLEFRSR